VCPVYNNVEGELNGTLGESDDAAFVPAGGISLADGQALIAAKPATATLDLEFFRETRWSQNVIASSKTGNQDNVIFIGKQSPSKEKESVPNGHLRRTS